MLTRRVTFGVSGKGFSFGEGLYSGFLTVRFVLAGPTGSDEPTALLFPADALLSVLEFDFLCLLPPEFRSSELASLFLFGVAFLLAGENDVGVDVGVEGGARVLLAGPGLYFGLFAALFLDLLDMPEVPDVPAVLLASSHGCSKAKP